MLGKLACEPAGCMIGLLQAGLLRGRGGQQFEALDAAKAPRLEGPSKGQPAISSGLSFLSSLK